MLYAMFEPSDISYRSRKIILMRFGQLQSEKDEALFFKRTDAAKLRGKC
jgi:hypothetical protein